MVQTYWNIEKMIVEYEQKVRLERCMVKKFESISKALTDEFNKGFVTRNL